MGAYQHVIVLLSFIYALALTHLFTRIGALLLARERVTFSTLLAMAQANAILTVCLNWLFLWNLHDIQVWQITPIIIELAFASAVFFLCIFCAPDVAADDPVDMEAFYWRQRVPFYGAALAVQLIGMAGLAVYAVTANSGVTASTALPVVAMVVPTALALLMRARWAQWAGAVGYFVLMLVGWMPNLTVGGLHG